MSKRTELPELLVRILTARGITSPEEIERFLNPRIADFSAPEELPGIECAAEVIYDRIVAGGKIVVFGDYDCDGVSATAIMTRSISAVGGKSVEPFIPRRLDEGYGMSDKSVARMLKENPDVRLVVTVDNGINSIDEIAMLNAHGISVVVTDHHLPGEELPAAKAIVDPKHAAPEHLQQLCGAGVAYLLAQALVMYARRETGDETLAKGIGGALFTLAGLATVTDVMPLLGQNRILVAESLRHFHSWAPLGLRKLFERAARCGTATLTTKDFGFMIGPRINAAGRMKNAMEALELVLSDDVDIASELARMVDDYNRQRKEIEQKMSDVALAQVVPNAAAQVIDLPDGHPGIAGIVAARVLEKIGTTQPGGPVPVCVIAGGHGSARSPEGLNIRDAMSHCSDVLERFGGHAAAAGFSVKPGKIDEFRAQLCAYCEQFRRVNPTQPSINVEAWVEVRELSLDQVEGLMRIAPFGEGNPEPVLGIRGAWLSDVRQLGPDGRHLQILLKGSGLRVVQWGAGNQVEKLRQESAQPFDIVFTPEISDYGERHVELRLLKIYPSDPDTK